MQQALHRICTQFVIDFNGPVGKHLKNLPLFHGLCGFLSLWPVVQGCDNKHVAKHARMVIKAVAWGMKIGSICYDHPLLTALLHEVLGYPYMMIKTMFGEGVKDSQNVLMTTKLMLAL